MNEQQDTKLVALTPPAAIVDNSGYTTAALDCKGWDHATIVVLLGATDIAMAALKVQESDDNASADDYDDVPGLNTDGDTNIDGDASTLPSATDDNKFVVFEVDMRGRKRYLDLVATAGDGTAGTYLTAFAILSRGKPAPTTISERGCDQILRPSGPPAA